MDCSYKLSLIDNSYSFLREAVKQAIAARDDVSQWPFSIIHLVQAVELSLKELLRRQHPVLIYDNIDDPSNTVSIKKALSRIDNKYILDITIPENEKNKIKKAIDLRNEITHFEFELTDEYAMAKFSQIFSFLVYFNGRYLKVEIEDILEEKLLDAVINIKKCFSELRKKAIERIRDENISSEWIWSCPNCGEDTFVIEDDRNVCFLCRKIKEVVKCAHCEKFWFDEEMHDFSELIDSDYEDGMVHIHNNYGYSEYYSCPECIGRITDDIESQRAQDYYHRMEEDASYRRR